MSPLVGMQQQLYRDYFSELQRQSLVAASQRHVHSPFQYEQERQQQAKEKLNKLLLLTEEGE